MSGIIKPNMFAQTNDDVVEIPSGPEPIYLKEPTVINGIEIDEETQVICETAQNAEVIDIDYNEILQTAQKNAEQLAQKIMIHAKKERGNLLADATFEANKLKEQGRREGYAAGVKEKAEQIDEALNNLTVTLENMKTDCQNYFDEYNKQLKFLALQIAEKVVGTKLDEDEKLMIPLVKKAVDTVKDCDWVTVEMSNTLAETATFLDKEYQKATPGKARIEVRGSNIGKTECILKTPEGVIDASVEVQLSNLKEYFTNFDVE